MVQRIWLVSSLALFLAGTAKAQDAVPWDKFYPTGNSSPIPPDPPIQKAYPIADLIVPVEGGKTQEEWLMKKITTTIQASWKAPDSMKYYRTGMVFVINQPPEVHKKIANLIETMRRFQSVETKMQSKLAIFKLPALNSATQVGVFDKETSERINKLEEGGDFSAVLSGAEREQFLKAIQTSKDTTITDIPAITTYSGQRAQVEAIMPNLPPFTKAQLMKLSPNGEPILSKSGLECSLRITVAGDLRTLLVEAGLHLNLTTLTKSTSIQEGETLLMGTKSGDRFGFYLMTPAIVIE